MGSPAGRQPRWGKAGAPKRRGLPGAQRRVSTSQAEAAPAVAEGQHEWGAGAPAGRGAVQMEKADRINPSAFLPVAIKIKIT